MVAGHSMILPGTIPETPISREWSQRLEQSLGVVPTGERHAGGFVNSPVNCAVNPTYYLTHFNILLDFAEALSIHCFKRNDVN